MRGKKETYISSIFLLLSFIRLSIIIIKIVCALCAGVTYILFHPYIILATVPRTPQMKKKQNNDNNPPTPTHTHTQIIKN